MPLIFLTLCVFLKSFLQVVLPAVVLYNLLVQPTFLSDHIFFVVLNLMVAEPSSQDTTWDKQEGNNYSWERKDRQSVSTQKQMYKSQMKYWILTNCFACPSEFGKERTTWNFTFLSSPGTTYRELGELTLVKILTLCWLWSVFPGFQSAGPRASDVSQQMSPETVEKGKKKFPCLRSSWLSLVFAKVPHK